ncbi:glycosyltransferase family 4 protein [Saliphagus sp. GCM10025317]
MMTGDSTSHSILYVTQYCPPETGAGPTRVKELCSRWSDAGHDVTVLTSAPDYPEGKIYEGYSNEWVHRESIGDVSVIMTKTIPASSGGLPRRALKFIWFMVLTTIVGLRLRKHDVVIATSPQPLTGVTGWLTARANGSKFVYEIRDLWPETITTLTDADERLLWPLGVLIRFLYRRADRIVVVSRKFESQIVPAGVDPTKIWFHPNGVTPSYFDHDGEEFKIEDGLVVKLDDAFVISYVGTIGRAHGLSVVLDAAEQLQDKSDVLFVLVGDGAEANLLESEAKKRGLGNVMFVGRRPKEQVPDFFTLSDVALVHLRDVELFRTAIPSKMFEAMGASVPIALGVRGEAEQILRDANAGLSFQPEGSDELADLIERLQEDPDLREKLASDGHKYVIEEFSWDSIAKEYESNILQIVDN